MPAKNNRQVSRRRVTTSRTKNSRSTPKRVTSASNVTNLQTTSIAAQAETNIVTSTDNGTLSTTVATLANDAPQTTNNVGTYQAASAVVGSMAKLSTVASEANNPSHIISASDYAPDSPYTPETNSAYDLQFPYNPLGEDANITCWMIITAFKYMYDKNDIPGNKRILDNELKTQVKRLYTARLPLPADIPTEFSAKWSDYTSVWGKIVRASNIEEGSQFDIEAFKQRLADLSGSGALEDAKNVGIMAGAAAGLLGGAGIGGAISTGLDNALTYLKVAGGIAINPMSQASYQGHDIREHTFKFNFMPRNADESKAAQKIIETFENSIHSEKSTELGGILMNYPDMFNIRFTGPWGQIIPGIIEIPDCHLTSVNVNYSSGTTGFKITKDHNPINYGLSLTFKEAQNLIRDDLKFLRQSVSQAKAMATFANGGALPADFDPNLLQQNIKPFDVAVSSTGATETATTPDAGPTEPPSLITAPDGTNIDMAPILQNATAAYLDGLKSYYTSQGTSNPMSTAKQDLIKVLRDNNHRDNKAMREMIILEIVNKTKSTMSRDKIEAAYGEKITAYFGRLATAYEQQVVSDNSEAVRIQGTNVTLPLTQGQVQSAQNVARNIVTGTPLGFAIEAVSQGARAVVNSAERNNVVGKETADTIRNAANVFGSKTWTRGN